MNEQLVKYLKTFQTDTAGILSGDNSTGLIDCGGMQLRGIIFPANWTDCNVSFNPAPVPDINQLSNLTNVDGSPLSIPTTSGQWLPLIPYLFDALPYLQIAGDSNQDENVILQLIYEPIYQGIHG